MGYRQEEDGFHQGDAKICCAILQINMAGKRDGDLCGRHRGSFVAIFQHGGFKHESSVDQTVDQITFDSVRRAAIECAPFEVYLLNY